MIDQQRDIPAGDGETTTFISSRRNLAGKVAGLAA